MANILLIDDERTFKDNRECVVATSSVEAIKQLSTGTVWDEVWFDFSLVRSDTIMNVLFFLNDEAGNATAPVIGLCRIHTSSFSGRDLIQEMLDESGYSWQYENHEKELHVV